MRSWEILSKTIFRLAAGKQLQKISNNSFEKVLKDSFSMLDQQTLAEIKGFVKTQQTSSGGFADKGGASDIYYTLFGYFISEALEMNDVIALLKEYVKVVVHTKELKGIYLNCAIILYIKLFGNEPLPASLRTSKNGYGVNEKRHAKYSDFINLLTYYYSGDNLRLYRVQKKLGKNKLLAEIPSPVTAAHLVIQECFGKPVNELVNRINSFYRKNGSFSATKLAPAGDLLSTGVALYALKFVNSDIRIIKPDCLNYIDSLFIEGGFCATVFDHSPDVEYTFYGLLALGALTD